MAGSLGGSLVVVDSWPVLEWLRGRDPGRWRFAELLQQARAGSRTLHMSRINHGEVIYSIRKSKDIADQQGALRKFLAAPITIHSVDDSLVDSAVELKSRYAFAYADAFAAALAGRLSAPVATGDKEFRALEADGVVQLHWLGA